MKVYTNTAWGDGHWMRGDAPTAPLVRGGCIRGEWRDGWVIGLGMSSEQLREQAVTLLSIDGPPAWAVSIAAALQAYADALDEAK